MARHIDCGINTDPQNPHGKPSPQEIRDLGASWVRFTFKDPSPTPYPTRLADYEDTVRALNQAGINILMVLSHETYPGKPASDADEGTWNAYIAKFAARCRQIAAHYGSRVQAYEIWNEPDFPAPMADYDPYVRAAVFGPMLKAVYMAVKRVSTAAVVMGGLAGGQWLYLQQVKAATEGVLYADAVGVHPYGRRPTPDWPRPDWGFGLLTDLIQDYYNIAHKPIWITEVGIETDEASFQAEFLRRTFEALNTNLAEMVPHVFWYCWSDGMGLRFGLVNAAGEKKKPYDSFRAFASLPLVAPPVGPTEAALADELFVQADAHQKIHFNPDAALQKRIFADGFAPNSGEFDVSYGGFTYRAQRAEHLQSGEVRVYYVQVPVWDKVWFISRSAEASAAAVIDRPSVHFSSRRGEQVRYVVVHSTDSPVGVPARNTLTYLVGPNDREVSAHELVLPEGQVYRLVSDDLAAHHCESQSVSFPDGTPWQLANERTWGIEAYQVKGQAVGQDVLLTTTERVFAACKRLGLDSAHVLGHREIDPGRKSDPVGVDMDQFRTAVSDLLLQDALLAGAEANLVIQFNPEAALQKRIFADGFVPNSDEFDLPFGDATYRAQRAEHLGSGKVRVYYVKVPEWEQVQFVERG